MHLQSSGLNVGKDEAGPCASNQIEGLGQAVTEVDEDRTGNHGTAAATFATVDEDGIAGTNGVSDSIRELGQLRSGQDIVVLYGNRLVFDSGRVVWAGSSVLVVHTETDDEGDALRGEARPFLGSWRPGDSEVIGHPGQRQLGNAALVQPAG